MVQPIIEFKYSLIYNRMFGKEIYDQNTIRNYISDIEKLWKDYNGIFKFLSKITTLK